MNSWFSSLQKEDRLRKLNRKRRKDDEHAKHVREDKAMQKLMAIKSNQDAQKDAFKEMCTEYNKLALKREKARQEAV